MTTLEEIDREHHLPAPTPLERLEDAVGAYFSGNYPMGTCTDRLEAERILAEAGYKAMERSPS